MNDLHEPEDPLDSPQNKAAARRSTYVSIVINVFLSFLQIIVGIFSGASSLIADGLHSFSDLVSDFVVLIAKHYSQKDADEDHPYGHHRYENAASLFIGLILIFVALGMIYSAVLKLDQPEQMGEVHIAALWVILLALVSKELLFRYMNKIAQEVKSSLLIANAWHARSDAASSLVAGLGVLGNLMGYRYLDPVAAIIVGFVIIKMGVSFTWDALHDLMDRTVDEQTLQEVKKTIQNTPGVRGLHDMKARKMGDLLILDVHLEVDGNLTVKQGHDIAFEARNRVLKNHHVLDVMTHVDPV